MNDGSSTMIDRARAYGDGVYETIAVRRGIARFWDPHMERLRSSCARLGIACPSADELAARRDAEISGSQADSGYASLRLVVAAARSARGYRRADSGDPELSMELHIATPLPAIIYTQGVTVRKCDLRLAEQPALAGIKSLNRLEQVLARAEWVDPDTFEGLMLDAAGRVICGTMSNVFAVINSTLCTPALTRCGVAGIMRAQVLRLLDDAGIDVDVRDIDATEFFHASECFLTNSQMGVVPIRSLDKKTLTVGPMTRQAQAIVVANGVPESAL